MQVSRRNLLKGLTLGSGAMLLPPMAQRVLANAEGKTSVPRFVFVVQSNGFDAVQACPESIPFQKYEDRDKFESARSRRTQVAQGIGSLGKAEVQDHHPARPSGRCTGGGHSTHGGCPRVIPHFRSEHLAPKHHHRLPIGSDHAGDSALGRRGDGIGCSGCPDEHFRTGGPQVHAHHPETGKGLQRLLQRGGRGGQGKEFPSQTQPARLHGRRRKEDPSGPRIIGRGRTRRLPERLRSIGRWRYKLLANKETLKKAAPKLDDRFTSEVATQRLEAQFELATSSLIGGLSNVATITSAATEINAQPYLGIGVNLSNHAYGHMGGNKRDAKGVQHYEKVLNWLFGLIAKMAKRLEETPEGNGNMLDNTVIVYMSDAPDTHHSTGFEWPLVLVGNLKGK